VKEGTDVLWKCPRCNNLNNTVSSDVEKDTVKCDKCQYVFLIKDLFRDIREKWIIKEIFASNGNCLKVIKRGNRR